MVYPLFGGDRDVVSWNDFVEGMGKFAIGDTKDWCLACGNFTGTCAAYATDGGNGVDDEKVKSGGNGLSPAVNGVIGAMVTLAVVLGVEALVLLVGGMRVVSKKRLAEGAGNGAVEKVVMQGK